MILRTQITVAVVVVLATTVIAQESTDAPVPSKPAASKPAPQEIKILAFKKTPVAEAEKVIREIFGASRGPRTLSDPYPPKQSSPPRPASAPRQPIRICTHPATNSLVVCGQSQELAAIQAIALRLDQTPLNPAKDSGASTALRKRIESLEKEFRALKSTQKTVGQPRPKTATIQPTVATQTRPGKRSAMLIRCPDTKTAQSTLRIVHVVKVGQKVNKGDVLVEIAAGPPERQLATLQKQLNEAKAGLQQIQRDSVTQEYELKLQEKSNELKAHLAEKEIALFKGESEIEQKALEVELSEAVQRAEILEARFKGGQAPRELILTAQNQIALLKLKLRVFQLLQVPSKIAELEGKQELSLLERNLTLQKIEDTRARSDECRRRASCPLLLPSSLLAQYSIFPPVVPPFGLTSLSGRPVEAAGKPMVFRDGIRSPGTRFAA